MADQDNKREDEWFLRNEKQLLDTARTARLKREQQRAAKEKAEETRRLKDLHLMKCPKCGHDMKEEPLEVAGLVHVGRAAVHPPPARDPPLALPALPRVAVHAEHPARRAPRSWSGCATT